MLEISDSESAHNHHKICKFPNGQQGRNQRNEMSKPLQLEGFIITVRKKRRLSDKRTLKAIEGRISKSTPLYLPSCLHGARECIESMLRCCICMR